jgi:hypothetical protein
MRAFIGLTAAALSVPAFRRKRLARSLGRRRIGIVLSEHIADEPPASFATPAAWDLKGVVSKRPSCGL